MNSKLGLTVNEVNRLVRYIDKDNYMIDYAKFLNLVN